MKNRYFFSVFFMLLASVSLAQFNSHQGNWHEGIIILENDRIVRGELRYDYANDLIMCRNEGKIQTFGPHQAVSFRFYEKDINLLRKFKVYEFAQNSFYKQKAFFEMVVDGDVKYVRKRNQFALYQPRDGFLMYRKPSVHEVAFDYYVMVDNELIKARKFKKEVLPRLILNEESVENYIKEQKLRTYDIRDQIVLLNYYNDRSDRSKPTAIGQQARKIAKSGSD